MTANPHQSCQTCIFWRPAQPVTLGVCIEFGVYQPHSGGKECSVYDPVLDGNEVIRRGQAIMEAEHATENLP